MIYVWQYHNINITFLEDQKQTGEAIFQLSIHDSKRFGNSSVTEINVKGEAKFIQNRSVVTRISTVLRDSNRWFIKNYYHLVR